MKDEKIFREKLYHHTMPVRDGLWEAIEAQLPPKDDRRAFPLFWFTLFGATLLGGALMIGLFNLNEGNPLPHNTEKSSIPVTEPSKTNETPLTNLPATSPSTPPSASIENNRTAKKATGKQSDQTTAYNPSRSLILANESLPVSAQTEVSGGSTDYDLSHRDDVNISLLPLSPVELNNASPSGPFNSKFRPDPNCYKFAGPGSKFAFTADLLGGPGFSPKTYEDKSNDSNYAEARKATESNQYAWSAGARINLHHRSGLTGRLGFIYTQAGDIFDYTDSLATQSTTRIDSFFAADGTFLYAETSQVLILGTLIKKIHNTYRYYDIPLIIGYELPMGRSSFMFNAGPVFNIASSQEGQILDPMLHPRSITDGEPGAINVYKTSLGVGIYLGAGMLFPLTDHISGLVEPSFLYRLKPVTLDSYPLSEHRHYAGLNVGIRYHFN